VSDTGKRLGYSVLMLAWLIALPIFALAMGFSGFLLLSPVDLLKDVAALPSTWREVMLRLACWLYVLWPVASYYIIVHRRRLAAPSGSRS
jgi:hypothetical protein